MNKPEMILAIPYYDLLEVLRYVDKTIPGFKDKVWSILCNLGYIANDTKVSINFEGIIGEDTPEVVVEGIKYMLDEFPYIKNMEVEFSISW